MIESDSFKRLAQDPQLLEVAQRRELSVSLCGNAVVLHNHFYGIFMMDVINEERLDVWMVDRRRRLQTLSLTKLIWTYWDQETCLVQLKKIRASIQNVGFVHLGLSSAIKFADYLFYLRFISDSMTGLECGELDFGNDSLQPIRDDNWNRWSQCMAS